jgi:phosphatidate cytidylyltransferase
VVWAADIGAYFVGRLLGRHKLAPKVSPGKTWEGVAGGMAGSLAVGVAGAYWFGIPAILLAPLAVVCGLVSVIGDLTVSVFKRNAKLKDSGWLLPGHGGVLDRIDSLTAAGPWLALGLQLASSA